MPSGFVGGGGRLAILFGLALLTSCSAVDQFSQRALSYNDQAEIIKEQQFLVNIMRAAYREPLQFSDFTQVTGQASVSGTATFSLPLSTFPSTLAKTYVATPGATVSGNQSFTIDNLNTQEFYEGILTPIPMSTIDYYMQADYPKALVLTLFVQRIEFLQKIEGAEKADAPAGELPESRTRVAYSFSNTGDAGGSPPPMADQTVMTDDYGKFEAILQAAIDLGLTTETVETTETIGPPMTAAQLSSLRYLAPLATSARLKTYEFADGKARPNDPHLTADEKAAFTRAHVTEYYRLLTSASKARFCFAAGNAGADLPPDALAKLNDELISAGVLRASQPLTHFHLPPLDICGADTVAADSVAGSNGTGGAGGGVGGGDSGQMIELDLNVQGKLVTKDYQIAISTRSVEGIMYYLGEWARSELRVDPAANAGTPPKVQTGHGQDELFVVSQDCPDNIPNISAEYDGASYCIAVDPTGSDRSAQVMEIVSQLFALNNSAKDLPSSSLISVLSP